MGLLAVHVRSLCHQRNPLKLQIITIKNISKLITIKIMYIVLKPDLRQKVSVTQKKQLYIKDQ